MLVSVTSFPEEESRMTAWDYIIALFYHVDEQLHDMPTHPEAHYRGRAARRPAVSLQATDSSKRSQSGTIVSFHHREKGRCYGTKPAV